MNVGKEKLGLGSSIEIQELLHEPGDGYSVVEKIPVDDLGVDLAQVSERCRMAN